MKMEKWKDVPGYEGLYQVSDLGNLRSLDRKFTMLRKGFIVKTGRKGQLIKLNSDQQGYLKASLNKIGFKQKTFTIHRLVAIAFLPNLDCFPEINHKNGIKSDNRVENLEWCNNHHNIQHAIANGLRRILRGEEQGCSKLTNDKVRQMRKLSETGLPYRKIAQMFNVSTTVATNVVKYKTWKHVA